MLAAQDPPMDKTKRTHLKSIAAKDLRHVTGGSPTLPLPPPDPDGVTQKGREGS
jgi:hypothetical protein